MGTSPEQLVCRIPGSWSAHLAFLIVGLVTFQDSAHELGASWSQQKAKINCDTVGTPDITIPYQTV